MTEKVAQDTGLRAPVVVRRRGNSFLSFIDRNMVVMFNLPTVVFLTALVAFPVVLVLFTSMTDWQLVSKQETEFIWFRNYFTLWEDPRWIQAIWHTFYYAVFSVIAQLVLGMATAMLFNRSFPGKTFYRSLWMMPMVAMSTAISLVWIIFFNNTFGILNHLLAIFSIPGIEWTSSPYWAMPSLILVATWHHTPFMTLLLLAGLQSLPVDPYEAAKIDGATRWQTLRHVTLPLMRGHIIVALILRSIFAIKEFDTILAITRGGPIGHATETMNINIYFNAFEYGYMGEAAAKGVVFFFFILAIQLVLARLRRREWSH